MPRIGANFIFDSAEPNFQRDAMTRSQMENITNQDLDIGHIVFNLTDNCHYIFKGKKNTNVFLDSWEKLTDEYDIEYISNTDIDRICV